MNLADMLTFADIGQLSAIAGRYEFECKRNSKHELIQALLSGLGSRTFMERQIRESAPEDLRFLNTLLFDRRDAFSLEDLLAAARLASFDAKPGASAQAAARETVVRFKTGGWLYNGAARDTRYLYRLPQDMKRSFREAFADYLREQTAASPAPDMYREEQGLCELDLAYLLHYIGEYEPELSHEGAMYRRSQTQLMSGMHIAEELLGSKGWRFGYGRASEHYPDRLALLYDFARHRRWISEEGKRLKLTTEGRDALLDGNADRLIQLFSFWLRLYKGAIPNLPSLVYWISRAAGDWVTAASLEHAVGWLIKPFYYDDAASIFDRRIVRMMLHLGMLRLGRTEEGTVLVMTRLGRELADPKRLLG